MIDYDPYAPAMLDAPWETYRRLRDEEPAHYIEAYDCWALSRFEDVWNAGDDPNFSSARGSATGHLLTKVLPLLPMLNTIDPPDHTRLRAALRPLFSPGRMRKLEPVFRSFVQERLDAWREREGVDVVTELAQPLATFVGCTVAGFPSADGAMLRELRIRNLAVVEAAVVPFEPGLNVLTGETGAGKSILLDALLLVAGARGASELIRADADTGGVEAVFAVDPGSPAVAVLDEAGLAPDDGDVVIRRELSRSGRHRAFLNDSPVTVALLERLAGTRAADALRAPFVLGDRGALTTLFEHAGSADVMVTTHEGIARFPGVRAMVEADLRGWLPVMGVVLSEELIGRILKEADRVLGTFVTTGAGGVEFQSRAHIVTAR